MEKRTDVTHNLMNNSTDPETGDYFMVLWEGPESLVQKHTNKLRVENLAITDLVGLQRDRRTHWSWLCPWRSRSLHI